MIYKNTYWLVSRSQSLRPVMVESLNKSFRPAWSLLISLKCIGSTDFMPRFCEPLAKCGMAALDEARMHAPSEGLHGLMNGAKNYNHVVIIQGLYLWNNL